MSECFLCKPRPELVYTTNTVGPALCGLRPLVPGYSVVAIREHLRSVADAHLVVPGFTAFARDVRDVLTDRFGSCVLTEHGRVPACVDISGTSDPHCYHAHLLLFPGAPPIEEVATRFFAKAYRAPSFDEAMAIAGECEEYFLVSDSRTSFRVLTRPGRLIRQLARAKREGRIGGRPKAIVSTTKMRKLADRGLSAVQIGAQLGCSRMTVARRLAEA